MAFATASSMRNISLRHIASSSRLTLLHPVPLPYSYSARPLSRSVSSSQSAHASIGSPLKPTMPRQASVAQHRPADTAAYEAVPAPSYISPVGGSASAPKETRRKPRAQKAAIKMVRPLLFIDRAALTMYRHLPP